MTPRRRSESQRAWVERALHTERRVSAYAALYEGAYTDGAKTSITRLAAIIWTLRHEAGWVIDESSEPGRLAVYTLVREGYGSARPRTTVPEAAPAWRCVRCGASAKREPEPMLGGMGRAACDCGSQTFRRAA